MTFFTRLLLTLLGTAFAVLFAVGVLFWLVLYVAFACVRWLFTGQKPQVLMMWQQIQAMRQGMQPGRGAGWSSTRDGSWHKAQGHASHPMAKSDVVEDVVVREIHQARQLPKE